jgi:predicted ribosomally synthesized peptide with nif11-like leader
MEQKLIQLQAKLEADTGLLEKLFSLESPVEVQNFLKDQGLDFTLEEINVVREALAKVLEKGGGELSDEDLENVAGGSITAAAVVGIIGAISGLIGATGGVVDRAVRSGW